MRQDIIGANKLHAPAQGIEYIGLLGYKLIVVEGHRDVLKELLNARVGHLVILRGYKDAGSRDEGHNLVLSFAAEMWYTEDMLANIRHL